MIIHRITVKQIFKVILILLGAISTFPLSAQLTLSDYGRYDSILVIDKGDTMVNPWAGGLNNPQFTEWDINKDSYMDLFVFDGDHGAARVFINTGKKGVAAYKHSPEYESRFPKMWGWALMVDFNNDGKADLFTAAELDIRVFKNTSTGTKPEDISFELITFKSPRDSTKRVDYISAKFYQNPGFFYTNVYNLPRDIPGLIDVDYDGDLDIIAYGGSNSVTLWENKCRNIYGHTDSLILELSDLCWGGFAETSQYFELIFGVTCKGKAPTPGVRNGSGGHRHSGSTLLMRDFDCNGQIDVLIGDVSFNKLIMGYNTGRTGSAKITKQDTSFPSYDTPANVYNFPAAFYLDADNDSTKNLIVAPNSDANFSNYDNIHLYKNNGTTQCPNFQLEKKDFLVGNMIEVGSNAFPLVIDVNGDSLNDILVGSFGVWTQSLTHESRFSYYKNTGTKSDPKYQFITRDYLLLPQSQDTGLYPTSGDLDGDGDLDLLIGTDRGNILFYENKAASINDSMVLVHTSTSFDTVIFGKSIRPYIYDVDNDGKLDLLIGSQLNGIKFYKNIGTKSSPNYSNSNVVFDWADIFHSNQLGFGNLSIVISDLDTNGKTLDTITDIKAQRQVFIGNSKGYLYRYTGLDSTGVNKVTFRDSVYLYTNDLSIANGDITGDGKPDFIYGQKSGGISVLLKDGGKIVAAPPIDTTSVKSIEQVSRTLKFKVYPNPTSTSLTLEIEGDKKLDIPAQIRDLTGRIVFTAKSVENWVFDVANLPSGMYWLELTIENKKMYQQIVKVEQ